MIVTNNLVGVEPTPLKNDGVRQLGLLFPIDGKIKNVPNHQPVMYVCIYILQLYIISGMFIIMHRCNMNACYEEYEAVMKPM